MWVVIRAELTGSRDVLIRVPFETLTRAFYVWLRVLRCGLSLAELLAVGEGLGGRSSRHVHCGPQGLRG